MPDPKIDYDSLMTIGALLKDQFEGITRRPLPQSLADLVEQLENAVNGVLQSGGGDTQ
ncbi:hypothetical protein [Hansschlegelia sp.]|uniref:hypothetical protein n=1 Tax=Hansschlegelia sp. TaxID=2041892 RepID=UPI002B548500|nr:hypothetical protein [Hansschlegelia sp.]HVI27638.1 hypothetical protein [Hansschlegelia sp.]